MDISFLLFFFLFIYIFLFSGRGVSCRQNVLDHFQLLKSPLARLLCSMWNLQARGWDLCLLHWQVDPTAGHKGRSCGIFFFSLDLWPNNVSPPLSTPTQWIPVLSISFCSFSRIFHSNIYFRFSFFFYVDMGHISYTSSRWIIQFLNHTVARESNC